MPGTFYDPNAVIETERLFLRPLVYSDALAIFHMISHDKDVLKYYLAPYIENEAAFAFYGCSSLESFYLPSKSYNPIVIACEISRFAFADCTNLKDLTVNHYCYIRASAFENCHSLSNVSITSCELIESRAFSGCCSLNAFSIPGNVSLLGDSVFHNCINLSFLDIPEKVKQIGNNIISGCISLKKVFSNISNPFFVSDWGMDVSGITLYVPEAAIAYYVLFDCWNQFKSIYGVIDSSYSVDDVNRDGSIDISDVVYLVNRILTQ